jgi:hypothetical protein
MELVERINAKNVRWLLANLSEDFLKANTQDGEEERFNLTQIKRILQKYKDGVHKTKYSKKDKFGILRDYGDGLQSMPTIFRGFLCKNMTDVDMVNAHPTIICNLCRKYNIPCHYLTEYIRNRKAILDAGVSKFDIIKSINKKTPMKCDGWLKLFDNEMKQIQKAFYAMAEFEKQRILAETKPRNKEGAFMSHLATTYEAIILHSVIPTDLEVGVLMYDGFMFYGEKPEGFLDRLSQKALEVGFEIKFAYKEHDNTLSVPSDWEDCPENLYETYKLKYEKEYRLSYVEATVSYSYKIDEKIHFFSISEISQHFSNVFIGKENFFYLWNKDPTKQTYKNIGVYAHDAVCPDGILNLWTGYDAERLPESDADPSPMINHIQTLFGSDGNFLLDWMANMFQYPSSQSILIILQGEEGCGKSVIIDFLSRMMGRNLSIEIQDVKEQLFSKFNGHLSNKVLLNINETDRREMMPFIEKLKTLITSETINIQDKGKKSYTEDNHFHLVMTVNPENPISIKEGSRRFFYSRASDVYIGNTEYFNDLFAFTSKAKNQRAFYQFLMARTVKQKITIKDIPETAVMQELYELNRDPIEDYAIEYTGEKTSMENYDAYRAWLTRNGLKYDVSKKNFEMKFSKFMNKYGIISKRKTIDGLKSTFYSKADVPTDTLALKG